MPHIGSLNILADTFSAADLEAKLGSQTPHGVAIGEGPSNPINWTTPGLPGQVLSGTGPNTDPTFYTLLSSGGISINTHPLLRTITISGSTSGFSWTVVSDSTPVNMQPNNGYIITQNAAANLKISPCALGEEIQVVGYNGTWTITLDGQFVNLVTSQTTTSLSSTSPYDTINLLCIDPTHYIITSTQGNITIA